MKPEENVESLKCATTKDCTTRDTPQSAVVVAGSSPYPCGRPGGCGTYSECTGVGHCTFSYGDDPIGCSGERVLAVV